MHSSPTPVRSVQSTSSRRPSRRNRSTAAYAGYAGLFADATHPKIEVGCWAHAHRYFEAARASDPELACQAPGFTGALFQIEERNRADGLAETAVPAVRQRAAVPILND